MIHMTLPSRSKVRWGRKARLETDCDAQVFFRMAASMTILSLYRLTTSKWLKRLGLQTTSLPITSEELQASLTSIQTTCTVALALMILTLLFTINRTEAIWIPWIFLSWNKLSSRSTTRTSSWLSITSLTSILQLMNGIKATIMLGLCSQADQTAATIWVRGMTLTMNLLRVIRGRKTTESKALDTLRAKIGMVVVVAAAVPSNHLVADLALTRRAKCRVPDHSLVAASRSCLRKIWAARPVKSIWFQMTSRRRCKEEVDQGVVKEGKRMDRSQNHGQAGVASSWMNPYHQLRRSVGKGWWFKT